MTLNLNWKQGSLDLGYWNCIEDELKTTYKVQANVCKADGKNNQWSSSPWRWWVCCSIHTVNNAHLFLAYELTVLYLSLLTLRIEGDVY